MTRIAVSGKTYLAALDPAATGAHEEGLVAVERRRVGRGFRVIYDLDDDHLAALIRRLDAVGVSLLDADDNSTREEGRSCLRDRDRLRKEAGSPS